MQLIQLLKNCNYILNWLENTTEHYVTLCDAKLQEVRSSHFRILTASLRKDGLASLYSALNFWIMSLTVCKELLQKLTELNPSILF